MQGFSNAEISKFDISIFGYENVLRFDISVNDFSFVDVLNCKADLCEPLEDLGLRENTSFRFDFSYFLVEIASVCIAHDDVEIAFWCGEFVVEFDDTLMVE